MFNSIFLEDACLEYFKLEKITDEYDKQICRNIFHGMMKYVKRIIINLRDSLKSVLSTSN